MPSGNLLCIGNFSARTGYAWDFINGIFRELAERHRGDTWVVYRMGGEPLALEGSRCRHAQIGSHTVHLLRFIRRHRIRTLYLTDRRTWDAMYPLLRLAGIRRIVVHDHTSGERTQPVRVKRLLKQIAHRMPWFTADACVAVSDFVARRLTEVNMVPSSRVRRIWNTLPDETISVQDAREEFGLPPEQAVIVCAARAFPEKGIDVLLRAFDEIDSGVLIYFGDGPAMHHIREVRDAMKRRESVILAGYRKDARSLVASADVCVVPSLWAEAFGLATLEPMAAGVPVIASDIGGLPEVITNDVGLLVRPGDVGQLAQAMRLLLGDGPRRERMGACAKVRAASVFSRRAAMDDLACIVTGA